MRDNPVKRSLSAGGRAFGAMVFEFFSPALPQLCRNAGAEFVLYDMEHSGFEIERICDLIAWSRATPMTPMVRVPQRQYHFLARVMDAGAQGVMVANVETPEQAREIVGAVKYAPMGHRGVGLGSAHTDYVVPDPASYFREANENTTVIAMIESPRGVANARPRSSVSPAKSLARCIATP